MLVLQYDRERARLVEDKQSREEELVRERLTRGLVEKEKDRVWSEEVEELKREKERERERHEERERETVSERNGLVSKVRQLQEEVRMEQEEGRRVLEVAHKTFETERSALLMKLEAEQAKLKSSQLQEVRVTVAYEEKIREMERESDRRLTLALQEASKKFQSETQSLIDKVI
jgi:hypothetical protein